MPPVYPWGIPGGKGGLQSLPCFFYTADCLILIPHKHIPSSAMDSLPSTGQSTVTSCAPKSLPEAAPQGTCKLPAHPQSAPAPLKGRPAGLGYTDRRDAGQTPLPRMLPRQTGSGSSLSLPPDAEALPGSSAVLLPMGCLSHKGCHTFSNSMAWAGPAWKQPGSHPPALPGACHPDCFPLPSIPLSPCRGRTGTS